ncbi:uncharacterized protein ACA1_159990 [Acanthamoeba castellanii str. Neff]|uniref:Carrier superfamily protein n=1 Tax=Acanthamoeba castellanii (strain ATCC 30010 / Neff) TaxID=1257118 RepID=L8HCQ1_ACACF|nr:uncharacterized protein ACA1_159990 [Acanthamoeba castellanii str. Neff]ELR22141.1 hypothetical protein ACA1_159990 [Acanthamoeba castellanii str. Neff]
MCGVMGKIVQDRSALSVLVRGNAHWRGLAAALVDDAVLAAQETKQLWREDGLLMLVKWPVLVVGTMVPFGIFGMATQPLFDQALGVGEEDIAEQTIRFHTSRVLNTTLLMLVVHPYNVLLASYVARNFPSWKVALVDRVVKGKDHFYSSWLASAAVGPVMCGFDFVRAKLLHWHKAALFPDFMPPRAGDDEEDDIDSEEDDSEEELGEPSTARRVAYVASTALALVTTCSLGAVLLTPLETITMRMAAQPHVYGPLGTLGTMAAIYRQEGVWGFLHGLVPSIIFQCSLGLLAVESEANTGHVAL